MSIWLAAALAGAAYLIGARVGFRRRQMGEYVRGYIDGATADAQADWAREAERRARDN